MNKEDKMEFLSILDKKGAFLIAKSSEKFVGILEFPNLLYTNIWTLSVPRKNNKRQ